MKSFEIMEALTDMSDELILLSEVDTQGPKSKRSKSDGARWLKWTAAAAAAIMLTTVSAYAADAVFNDGAIAARISEKITDCIFVESDRSDSFNTDTKPVFSAPKEEEPDDMETEACGSVTSNGATITPISAISDGRICYLHIRLEAPEGVVLEDLPGSRKYAFSSKTNLESVEVLYISETHTLNDVKVTALPDEDPTDNEKEFVLEMHSNWMFGFIGNKLRISIPGLWVRGLPESTERNYDCKLFSAEFELEFPVEHRNEKIDLRNLGVSHYIENYDFTVSLERVTITPIGLEIHYTATLPENEDVLPDGSYVQIVMKDGTRLTYGDQSNVSDGADVGYQLLSKISELHGINYTNVAREVYLDQAVKFGFEEQLVLEDVDYIVWCGGKIIDVN